MQLLIKPISSFTYQNICDFCVEGHLENIQLDYKKDFSPKGIAKHFASFSNTRGGVIVFGVEEDTKTGKPLKWDGLTNDSKFEEQMYQSAQNVEPYPNFEIHTTNDDKDKVFVLLRIFEGDRTPYYVLNDPNIYIRTGNITKRYEEVAHPDVQKSLFEKKLEAKKTRDLNNEITDSIIKNKLIQSQLELDRLKAIESQKQDGTRRQLFGKKLGMDDVAISTITLQPFYPLKNLAQPKTMLDEIHEYRVYIHGSTFPQQNRIFAPIPNGLIAFHYNEVDGGIRSEQIFSNGLFCDNYDILEYDRQTKQKKLIIARLILRLNLILHSAGKFYDRYGYQGGLVGNIQVSNTANATLGDIDRFDYDEESVTFLPKIEVPFELDTALLRDESRLKEFLEERIKEIYWCFGLKVVPNTLMASLLQ